MPVLVVLCYRLTSNVRRGIKKYKPTAKDSETAIPAGTDDDDDDGDKIEIINDGNDNADKGNEKSGHVSRNESGNLPPPRSPPSPINCRVVTTGVIPFVVNITVVTPSSSKVDNRGNVAQELVKESSVSNATGSPKGGQRRLYQLVALTSPPSTSPPAPSRSPSSPKRKVKSSKMRGDNTMVPQLKQQQYLMLQDSSMITTQTTTSVSSSPLTVLKHGSGQLSISERIYL